MKRALLVGIDRYHSFNSLTGCVNDVLATPPLLSRNEDESPNFDCHVLAGPGGVTRDRLHSGVRRLFAPGADVALLYVASHGITQNDPSS